MNEIFDLDDLRDNFVDRYADLEEDDSFWEDRQELQEELCRVVNERTL
jgi:hypothetical protein